MNSIKIYLFKITCLLVTALSISSFVSAQNDSTDDTPLIVTGRFSDKESTGIFVKGKGAESSNVDWSTFLGNDDKVYKVALSDDKLVELFVDGQKVLNENFSQYSAVIKPFVDNLVAQKELEKEISAVDAKTAAVDAETAEIDKITAKIDQAIRKIDEIRYNRQTDLSAARDSMSKLRDEVSKLRDSVSNKRDVVSKKRDLLSEKRDKASYMRNYTDEVLQKIISDLRTEGIAKNSNNVSFKLSNRELIVNGKPQSADIHQKLKAKYVADSSNETGFLYRWKGKI